MNLSTASLKSERQLVWGDTMFWKSIEKEPNQRSKIGEGERSVGMWPEENRRNLSWHVFLVQAPDGEFESRIHVASLGFELSMYLELADVCVIVGIWALEDLCPDILVLRIELRNSEWSGVISAFCRLFISHDGCLILLIDDELYKDKENNL